MMFLPGPPADRLALPERFRFGAIEVDLPGMRVWRDGAPAELEPKAFDVLVLLAANPGRVVSKDELIERVWADAGVSDNALTRVIAQVRRELGDDAGEARYVETVRTRGYRFLPAIEAVAAAPRGPVAEVAAGGTGDGGGLPADPAAPAPVAAAAPLPPHAGAGATPASTPSAAATHRRARVLALSLGALALAAAAAIWVVRDRRGGGRPPFALGGTPVQLTTATGYDGQPAFAPDGGALVYVGERGDNLELVIHRLDGGDEAIITSGEVASDPAWSPDGRWIAYHSLRRGGIWLISPLGGVPRRVTDYGSQPAWSPDSRRLVFRSREGPDVTPWAWAGAAESVLLTVDVEAGAVEPLTRPGSTRGGHGMPTWSPDGRTIVFAAGEHRAAALYRIPASGGEPRLLTAEDAPPGAAASQWSYPVFTPDGRSILTLRAGRAYAIVRVDIDTGAVAPVLPIAPSGIAHLAISADGRRLAWTVAEIDSAVAEVPVDAAGHRAGPPRDLVRDGRNRVSMPAYAPGGERLLFSRRRGGTRGDVELLDRRSLATRLLHADGYRGTWLSEAEAAVWAPSLLLVEVASGRRRELPGVRDAAREVARLGSSSGSWSPDLRRVAISGRVGTAVEVFSWSIGDREARRLTHLGGFAHYPVWSRDGAAIAFQVAGTAGEASEQLWTMRADGSGQRAVTSARGRSWSAAFSPDGRRVAYAAKRGGRWDVGVSDLAGGGETLLGVNDAWTAYVRWLDWSPGGEAIAYERTRVAGDVWALSLPDAPRPPGEGAVTP